MNGPLTNAILFTKSPYGNFIASIKTAYVSYIFSGKNCSSMATLAASLWLPSRRSPGPVIVASGKPISINSIFDIIDWCSESKMIWINTSPIVARMQYAHPFWNWAVSQLPGIPMSRNMFRRICRKRTIPRTHSSPSPFPTSVWVAAFINKIPEAVLGMFRFCGTSAAAIGSFLWHTISISYNFLSTIHAISYLSLFHAIPLNNIPPPLLPEVSPVRDWAAVYGYYNGLFFKQQSLTGDK